jgi:MFS transporter, DHA1 family, tetracycline resistance protein
MKLLVNLMKYFIWLFYYGVVMTFFIAALPLFLILFIDGMGLGLVFPLVNSLIVDPSTDFLVAGTTDSTRSLLYGVIIGIFMICWFFGAAILGDLSDSIGRKKALMICLLGSFGGYCLASVAVMLKSVGLLIAGRVIAGFTSGSQPIAQAAIVDISTLKTKARNIGFILMSLSLGFVVGPILGGVFSNPNVVTWFTFSTPFTFVALLSLLNALLLQVFFKETFIRKDKISIKYFHAVKVFISAFQHPHIRFLALIFLIFMLGWSNYYTYATYFVYKRYGFDTLQTTLFMAWLGVGFALGTSFLTELLTRYMSIKKTIILSLILSSISTLIFVMTNHPFYAWATVVPTGAFAIVAYSASLALFSNQVDQNSQGWVMGITGAIMALSFGIIGLLGGILLHQSENIPFVVCIAGLVLAAILMVFYQPTQEGQP